MAKICTSLAQLIGNTPVLELTNFQQQENISAHILAKLEYFNPAGSVKVRPLLNRPAAIQGSALPALRQQRGIRCCLQCRKL